MHVELTAFVLHFVGVEGWVGFGVVVAHLLVGGLALLLAALAAGLAADSGAKEDTLWGGIFIGVVISAVAALVSPAWVEVPGEGILGWSSALFAEYCLGLSISGVALAAWSSASAAAALAPGWMERRRIRAAEQQALESSRADALAREAARAAEVARVAHREARDVEALAERYWSAEARVLVVEQALLHRGATIEQRLSELANKPGRERLVTEYRAERVLNDDHLARVRSLLSTLRRRRCFILGRRPLVVLTRAAAEPELLEALRDAGGLPDANVAVTTVARAQGRLLELANAADVAVSQSAVPSNAEVDPAVLAGVRHDAEEAERALRALAARLRDHAARCDAVVDQLRFSLLKSERPTLDLTDLVGDLAEQVEAIGLGDALPPIAPVLQSAEAEARSLAELASPPDLRGLESLERAFVADLLAVQELERLLT